jgi:hypothetical protein
MGKISQYFAGVIPQNLSRSLSRLSLEKERASA